MEKKGKLFFIFIFFEKNLMGGVHGKKVLLKSLKI